MLARRLARAAALGAAVGVAALFLPSAILAVFFPGIPPEVPWTTRNSVVVALLLASAGYAMYGCVLSVVATLVALLFVSVLPASEVVARLCLVVVGVCAAVAVDLVYVDPVLGAAAGLLASHIALGAVWGVLAFRIVFADAAELGAPWA